ncbi:efflux RND transporter periplasmic adaptor subunit [Parasegetibacter sp. NRK P23]|uniref:efflux RND transporter periplasmic adaptor subunit n=1 Tax=Parasegetibacter sp. NRK P23 TaxID=2942999 RepID=UPI0020430487|nr:efflux RND transporter periplasmic adaptor subunit [Parasegetibacter sp. NRK P23]MCM5527723.1 efflux RND transporter periplasmic adaptor subunit [Parasegetibacter sp. NRK P23]
MKNMFMLMSLCAALTYVGCSSHHEEKEAETKYTVTTPLQMDTAVVRNYVCQIRSIQHIELRAQERGYLQKIFVDEGQYVKKGQLLFQIMPQLYEAEAEKARAEVEFAEIEYQNTKKLTDNKVVSPNELAMAKAKLAKAKAELGLTQVHLQFTSIRAPFDGIIDRFLVRPGSLVDEGDLLTSLSDNSQMWVYFNVPEAEYLDYASKERKEKLQVQLRMANNVLFPYTGVVETIEADFDNETGNIPFRATFPNPKKLLRHGETGNVCVTELQKNALVIPQKATYEVMDKKFVYVVDKDKKVHAREITVGAELDDLFLVSSGLSPNEQILLEGIRKVQDGDRIDFEVEAPREVMAHLKLPTQ